MGKIWKNIQKRTNIFNPSKVFAGPRRSSEDTSAAKTSSKGTRASTFWKVLELQRMYRKKMEKKYQKKVNTKWSSNFEFQEGRNLLMSNDWKTEGNSGNNWAEFTHSGTIQRLLIQVNDLSDQSLSDLPRTKRTCCKYLWCLYDCLLMTCMKIYVYHTMYHFYIYGYIRY